MANPDLYKELKGLRQEAIKGEQKQENTYYVYLEGICGTEFIGSGTKEQCEQIKQKKDAEWKPGYMWQVSAYDHKIEESNYWD